MQSDFISASDMILSVCDNISSESMNESIKLSRIWKEVVGSIKTNSINGKNIGIKLAGHSKIVDLKNGILYVEADHPGWIQMLGNYKKYILKGINSKFPELKIEMLAFYLSNSNDELKKTRDEINLENEKNRMNQRIEEEEKEMKCRGVSTERLKSGEGTKKLPPEIQKIFDSLKNDVDE